jgi:hypothetical protein
MTLAREPVDTAAILRTTIDTSRPAISAAISAKQIRLEEHISDSLPRIAEDPHRLQQVFSNLLSNALKFTPDRGSILVTLHKAGGVLRFDITDTGIGIRREVLPFVFDRFRQGDSSTTRHHGGLGLGLAIVRHIVEQHGGKIEAFSGGEGHGTTVTVVIPVDEGADASLRRRSSGAGGSDDVSKALRDATILVVEDHDDARELIAGCWRAPGRTCSWPRRPTRPLNARGRRSRTSCWPTWARRAKTASRCCGTFGPSILVFRPSR